MKEREREGRYGGILGVWGPWASEPDYAPRDDLNLGRGQIASIIMAKPGLGLCLGLRRLVERAGVTTECRQTLSLSSCVQMSSLLHLSGQFPYLRG